MTDLFIVHTLVYISYRILRNISCHFWLSNVGILRITSDNYEFLGACIRTAPYIHSMETVT